MTGRPNGASPSSRSSRPMMGWVMMKEAPASDLPPHLLELGVLGLVGIEGDAAGELAGVFPVDVPEELDRRHGHGLDCRSRPARAGEAAGCRRPRRPAGAGRRGPVTAARISSSSFSGVERVEVDHQPVRRDGQPQEVDRLDGSVAQQAHGVVGDADGPARLHDLPVFFLEGPEVLLDVLGAPLGGLELDVKGSCSRAGSVMGASGIERP